MGLLDDIMLGIEIFSGGVGEVRKQDSQRQAIGQASQELEALGLPAATEIATLLQQDPRAANTFVMSRYGGWPEMFAEFQKQTQARASAESLRAAGGGANVSPAVRARREFSAGRLDAGGTLPSAGQLAALFPGVPTLAQLGLNVQDWEGDSIKTFLAAMQVLGGGTPPPYYLLIPRRDEAGKVPEGMKIPTGFFFDPDDKQRPVKPIPGTAAENQAIYDAIVLESLEEGLAGSLGDFDGFLDRHPGYKAFVQGHLSRPGASAIEKMIAASLGGGTPGPSKRPPVRGENPRNALRPGRAPSDAAAALAGELPK